MIKSLKKRHLQIWMLWAILLPAGIIVAYTAVPKKVTQELLQSSKFNSEKIIVDKLEFNNYAYRILVDSDYQSSKMYLEFINKKELVIPSLLIYQIIDKQEKNIDKQQLLGRVESKGSQLFALDHYSSNWHMRNVYGYKAIFVLYDFLNRKVIDTIFVNTPPLGKIDYSNF